MKTELTINVRAFSVLLKDQRTGEETWDTIVLTIEQLRAAQLVGESSKELICRLCRREGYGVLAIGKAAKREISMDLSELYRLHSVHQAGKRVW